MIAAAPAVQAEIYDEFGIGTETVDADLVDGPKWVKLDFKPRATGSHVIRILSASDADLQFTVFRENYAGDGGTKIATTSGSRKPRLWKGYLNESKNYYLGVWSSRGSAKFTAKVQAIEPLQAKSLSDLTTRPIDSWQVRGVAKAVVVAGETMFVGGNFTEVFSESGGSLPRRHLAGIDRTTGEPTGFAPTLDGTVYALALSPDESTLYVGGAFRMAEGEQRKYVAAYDVTSGMLTDFDPPSLNSGVRAIAVDGDKVYLGGLFTSLGGTSRNYVAAVEAGTGRLDTEFLPQPNGKVNSLVVGVDRLWLGGEFTRIDGIWQKGLGAVDPVDGQRQPAPRVDYPVIDLALSDTQLFVAGGGAGGSGAAFSRATGEKQWEIRGDGNFQAVDVFGDRFVYFGGHYDTIEGNGYVDRLTRHDAATGAIDLGWLPQVNGYRSINSIDVTADGVHVGGDFTKVSGEPHQGFAVIVGDPR